MARDAQAQVARSAESSLMEAMQQIDSGHLPQLGIIRREAKRREDDVIEERLQVWLQYREVRGLVFGRLVNVAKREVVDA